MIKYSNFFSNTTNNIINIININEISSDYNINPNYNKNILNSLIKIKNTFNINNYIFKTENVLTKPSIVNLLYTKMKISNIHKLEEYFSKDKKNIKQILDIITIQNYIKKYDKNKKKLLMLIYDNKFMPFNIIQWIEEQTNKYMKISCSTFTIHILYKDIISAKLIEHILIIIEWLNDLSTSKLENINIYLYFCDINKKMDNNILGRIHINSGVSWRYKKWIQIYRSEEIIKVLIHELIHYLEMDLNQYSEIINNYCNHINISEKSNKILVNEAYTEFLAINLYILYISNIISIKESKNIDLVFNYLSVIEEKFMIYQINKIFKNYNIEDISYFKNKNNFIQHTSVLSYYLIKYLFYINTKFLIKNYDNNTVIIKLIKYTLKNFYKLKIQKTNIYDNCARMSLFELNKLI
jgi:hypothetical protein